MEVAYQSKNKYVLIFEKGEDFKETFLEFLKEENIESAFFYGLGGFLSVEIAFYDLEGEKEYLTKEIEGPFEVANVVGNVSLQEGELSIHNHVTLGRGDYKSRAGHLVNGIVGGTLEVKLDVLEEGEPLTREFDEETGLDLLG
ncbi:MAG: PPC domain-containing DNA-binding protein [Candidatus Magasanikbacteria bacterium]